MGAKILIATDQADARLLLGRAFDTKGFMTVITTVVRKPWPGSPPNDPT